MDYKVGLVAELIGGNKKKPASGKLADLFSAKSTGSTATQQARSEEFKSEPSAKKVKKSKSKKVVADSKSHSATPTNGKTIPSPTPGFNPPPGIVHESLAATDSSQKQRGKRKKKLEDDGSDTDAQSSEPKRPRRDRLKKASEKRTIFVGNVPLSCNKKKLVKLFKGFGEVESVRFRCAPVADPTLPKRVAVITKEFHDQRNNISAYLCFKEKESAEKALSLNGHIIDGLHLRVDLAASSKTHEHSRSIFVGNLPFSIEEESVRTHFEDCGDIENVRIIRDRKTNLGKGFCYILFKSKDSVSLAMKLQNSKLEGRELRIERSSEQGASQQKKKKTKPSSATANRSTGSADTSKFKHPKFWQPTNSITAAQGPKSLKDKKMKKAQLKKKRRKVDEITRVLGPLKQPTSRQDKHVKKQSRDKRGMKQKQKGKGKYK